MQWFLSDSESRWLNLKIHHLILTIAMKTLDKNKFKNTQKTTDSTPPSFQVSNKVYFKKTTWKMGFGMESWIQDCPHWAWQTLAPYRKSGHRKDPIIQCQRYCTQTTSQAMEHGHSIWQSYSQPYIQHHTSLSLFHIGMLTETKQEKPQHKSVLFHLVLKAYPTHR